MKDPRSFGKMPELSSGVFIDTLESDQPEKLNVVAQQAERKYSLADCDDDEFCEEIKEEQDNRCSINKKLIKK